LDLPDRIPLNQPNLTSAVAVLLQRRIENATEMDVPPVEIRIDFELVVRRSTAALG
jgi:hypothetical protein